MRPQLVQFNGEMPFADAIGSALADALAYVLADALADALAYVLADALADVLAITLPVTFGARAQPSSPG